MDELLEELPRQSSQSTTQWSILLDHPSIACSLLWERLQESWLYLVCLLVFRTTMFFFLMFSMFKTSSSRETLVIVVIGLTLLKALADVFYKSMSRMIGNLMSIGLALYSVYISFLCEEGLQECLKLSVFMLASATMFFMQPSDRQRLYIDQEF